MQFFSFADPRLATLRLAVHINDYRNTGQKAILQQNLSSFQKFPALLMMVILSLKFCSSSFLSFFL